MLQLVLEGLELHSLGRQVGLTPLDMLSQFVDLDCFALFCVLGLLILSVHLLACNDECLLESPKVPFELLDLGPVCLVLNCQSLDIAKGWESSEATVRVVIGSIGAMGWIGDGERDGSCGDAGGAASVDTSYTEGGCEL